MHPSASPVRAQTANTALQRAVTRVVQRPQLLTAAPIVSALLVLAFGLLVRIGTGREAASALLVQHTHSVIELTQAVLTHLLDAETGERGFIITGEEAYLEPYLSAPGQVAGNLDSLRALTADNPRQQLRLDTLDALANRLLGLLGERVAERRVQGFSAVRLSINSNLAKILMDSARIVVGEVVGEEKNLLDVRERSQTQYARSVFWVVILGTMLAGGLAAAIAVALARHAAAQEGMAHQLGEKNVLLEDQTLELELQAEELRARTEALELTKAQLIERTQEAESANQAKAEFLARMSHELRTPLNAIGGYVDLIELGVRGPVTPEQRRDLGRVKQSGAHLLTLINDLLHFSKLEAGRVQFDLVPLDPDDVIAEVQPMITPQADARGVGLVIEPSPGGVLMVADREKCRQILINLLANACKFTPPGGSITVRSDANNDRVLIHVADTGPGIPADELEGIFDPFVQVHTDSQKTANGGIGLGLPISRDLARGMGGDLTVDSELRVGSTFTLALPQARAFPGRSERRRG